MYELRDWDTQECRRRVNLNGKVLLYISRMRKTNVSSRLVSSRIVLFCFVMSRLAYRALLTHPTTPTL
jgi:hypothetical protein